MKPAITLFVPKKPALPVMAMLGITLGGTIVPFIVIVSMFSLKAGLTAICVSLATAFLCMILSLYLAGVRIVESSKYPNDGGSIMKVKFTDILALLIFIFLFVLSMSSLSDPKPNENTFNLTSLISSIESADCKITVDGQNIKPIVITRLSKMEPTSNDAHQEVVFTDRGILTKFTHSRMIIPAGAVIEGDCFK